MSGSTRNHYRAALVEFGRWLAEREVIPRNHVKDVQRHETNDARMVFYGAQEARRLIESLPAPQAALESLMAVTGIEWSAALRVRRSDIDVDRRKVFAQGTKTDWRTRHIYGARAPEWSWAWDIVAKHVRRLTPNELLFPGFRPTTAIYRHQSACKRQGLPKTSLHDWRHTYAVAALKRGEEPRYVKQNLGHSPRSTLLETVYGVWIPDEREREEAAERGQKSPAKSPKGRKAGGLKRVK
jgi:integrase